MLEKAIEKIREMTKKENGVFEIDGRTYVTGDMHLVEAPTYKPSEINVHSLGSLATLILTEAVKHTDRTIYVHVDNHREVNVFTTFVGEEKCRREHLYSAYAEVVDTPVDRWTDKDEFIIALNSVFSPSDDIDYIQSVLNKMTEESNVTESDNGLGQRIEVQKGIALRENITLKPRVLLSPYRTFMEVEQPFSEFILRAKEGGRFLIKSADGDKWKLDAKARIKEHLVELIGDAPNVVVMA